MEGYTGLLLIILVTLIAAFAYLALALSSLKDDVQSMYMNSASDFALDCIKNRIVTEIDDQTDKVLTEIACLATKNNADIQRVREGYKPGDVIEYNGDQYVVFKLKHVRVIDKPGLIEDVYCVYNVESGDVDSIDRDVVDKNSKFLRHVDLLLEEPVL